MEGSGEKMHVDIGTERVNESDLFYFYFILDLPSSKQSQTLIGEVNQLKKKRMTFYLFRLSRESFCEDVSMSLLKLKKQLG